MSATTTPAPLDVTTFPFDAPALDALPSCDPSTLQSLIDATTSHLAAGGDAIACVSYLLATKEALMKAEGAHDGSPVSVQANGLVQITGHCGIKPKAAALAHLLAVQDRSADLAAHLVKRLVAGDKLQGPYSAFKVMTDKQGDKSLDDWPTYFLGGVASTETKSYDIGVVSVDDNGEETPKPEIREVTTVKGGILVAKAAKQYSAFLRYFAPIQAAAKKQAEAKKEVA